MRKLKSLIKSWWFWGAISLIFVVLGILYILYFTNVFTLREIRVSSNKRITKEEVIELTRLKGGERIFLISLEELRERILSNKNIEEVTIARRLPGTLEIIIKEREPLAILEKDNKGYLIDKKGVILDRILPEDYFFYPVVKIHDEKFKEKLFEFLWWLKNNKNYLPVYENISQVILEENKAILVTKNHIKIYVPLVSEKDYVYFYKHLDRIMAYLYEKELIGKVEVIRLDYPIGQALIKFRESRYGGT